MTTAGQVARELREFAEALEKEPNAEIPVGNLDFYVWLGNDKHAFMNLARIFPRPFDKKYDENNLKICINGSGLNVWATIPRSAVCKLVKPAQPAEYDCEPLLSPDEEESLTKAQP